MTMLRFAVLLCLCWVGLDALTAAEGLRVEVVRDTWISSYPTEVEGNNGASAKLKFKGVQEFALLDLDASGLKGKRVVKAQLHLCGQGAEVLGRMTVSTMMDEWVEGTGERYAKVQGASSFAWAETGLRRWGGRHADITGVTLGNGGSVWCFADASTRDAGGWQVIPVDPAVVQARLEGRGYGFCVMDDVGSEYSRAGDAFTYRPFLNRYVASKDDKKSTRPFFTLWLEDAAEKGAVGSAAVKPAAEVVAGVLPGAVVEELRGVVPDFECKDVYGRRLKELVFYAAKGECMSFCVGGGAVLEMPGLVVKSFGMPWVGEHVDPLVEKKAGAGGTCFDVYVPKSAEAGVVRGLLRVGEKPAVPVVLRVWGFSLPDGLSFIPQMNAYSLPGHELGYYRMAHEHRLTLNVLPYHWQGSRIDAGPVIRGDGSWDWGAWDGRYGPLFDGSAFADLPRAGVPIEAFYLMLNEGWPMDHDAHFKGGYWIEDAYDAGYWEKFREGAGRIAQHLAEKKWAETMFEFYLNNKVSFKTGGWRRTTAAWILDEPSNTQDFWALRWYGLEFWRAVAGYAGPRLVYRGDISRPQWQRDLFDGVMNVEVMSGALRTYTEMVRERGKRYGQMYYMYGSANPLGTSAAGNAAWCVEAWAMGADGVIPWQTIGKKDAWEVPDDLAVFYPTGEGPAPSLRMKSFCAGQQLVEYLTMYAAVSGQSREAVGLAVLDGYDLRARTVKKNEDDAGKSAFSERGLDGLRELRWRLGCWLDKKKPEVKQRWYDPRPPRCELGGVRDIQAVRP